MDDDGQGEAQEMVIMMRWWSMGCILLPRCMSKKLLLPMMTTTTMMMMIINTKTGLTLLLGQTNMQFSNWDLLNTAAAVPLSRARYLINVLITHLRKIDFLLGRQSPKVLQLFSGQGISYEDSGCC